MQLAALMRDWEPLDPRDGRRSRIQAALLAADLFLGVAANLLAWLRG